MHADAYVLRPRLAATLSTMCLSSGPAPPRRGAPGGGPPAAAGPCPPARGAPCPVAAVVVAGGVPAGGLGVPVPAAVVPAGAVPVVPRAPPTATPIELPGAVLP